MKRFIVFTISGLVISIILIGIFIFKDKTDTSLVQTTNNLSIETENIIKPVDFQYQLKENYSSREEILIEREKLENAYYEYGNNVSREDFEEAEVIYDQLDSQLFTLLNSYPPTENEILSEKEYMLNMHVSMCAEDIYFLKIRYSGKPTDELLNRISDCEKKYNYALEIQGMYKSNQITIDKALEKLGVQNSLTLENYYKQIEAAKSDNQ